MKIIFIPDYSKDNPYQELLSKSLNNLGVNVGMVNTIRVRDVFKQKEKINVLHVHWTNVLLWPPFIPMLKLMLIRIMGTRIVWTMHNLTNHEQSHPRYEKFFNYFLLIIANKIIVHSESGKKIVSNYFRFLKKGKVKIIPIGHYIGYYNNDISKEEARRFLNLNESNTVLLFLGYIRKYKGLTNLINSFKQINDDQIKLLIAGKTNDKWIEEEVLSNCRDDRRIKLIFEYIPTDMIQVYMNAADLYICPFENILTSSSVILAMSFARPVIAPDIGCIRDTIDNEGGFLYDASDSNALLETMTTAINTQNLTEMGRNNFRKAAKDFDWNEIGRKTHDVYKKALGWDR